MHCEAITKALNPYGERKWGVCGEPVGAEECILQRSYIEQTAREVPIFVVLLGLPPRHGIFLNCAVLYFWRTRGGARDPNLLTFKAAPVLLGSDVILYNHPVTPAVLGFVTEEVSNIQRKFEQRVFTRRPAVLGRPSNPRHKPKTSRIRPRSSSSRCPRSRRRIA
jgi:hypothetical protein